MRKFAVTITARVTKTLEIEAETEDEAIEIAHTEFSVGSENGVPEKYTEDTDSVKEITE